MTLMSKRMKLSTSSLRKDKELMNLVTKTKSYSQLLITYKPTFQGKSPSGTLGMGMFSQLARMNGIAGNKGNSIFISANSKTRKCQEWTYGSLGKDIAPVTNCTNSTLSLFLIKMNKTKIMKEIIMRK